MIFHIWCYIQTYWSLIFVREDINLHLRVYISFHLASFFVEFTSRNGSQYYYLTSSFNTKNKTYKQNSDGVVFPDI